MRILKPYEIVMAKQLKQATRNSNHKTNIWKKDIGLLKAFNR